MTCRCRRDWEMLPVSRAWRGGKRRRRNPKPRWPFAFGGPGRFSGFGVQRRPKSFPAVESETTWCAASQILLSVEERIVHAIVGLTNVFIYDHSLATFA